MQSNQHKIKKGLDILIPGTATKTVTVIPVDGDYAVRPPDYVGVTPRLLVSEGDTVDAGTPLFEDKNNEGIPFVSPVSGTVKAIVRGEKRALLAVVIARSNENCNVTSAVVEGDAASLRQRLITSGLWTRLRQRPFGIVPRKDSQPKAVFVTTFDSSPLPVDIEFILQDRKEDFQRGIDVLHAITGHVYLSLEKKDRPSFLSETANAEIHYFEGPHPAGLPGTHIACISPINKGEAVWTVGAQDVAIIGHLFRTGEYLPERTIAICGPCVDQSQYLRVIEGAQVNKITDGHLVAEKSQTGHLRIICGDVLSGTAVTNDDYLCAGCDKVCVIPEGDYYDFMGWLRPNFKKYSFSRTFLSGIMGLMGRLKTNNPKIHNYDFDTGRHGSHRPLFVTGEFEKLVPLDIYPTQLIKACIIGDIELMENLGIYEVEPEDLALCEFADTSKTEIQAIIREGLEKIRKEG